MEAKIKEILFTFACVTTLVTFATAIYITIFWNDPSLSVNILWEILGSSALCSLGNLIYIQGDLNKKQELLRIILHYIYINVVVLGCGIAFQWFYLEQIPMVVGMLVNIAVIFTIVMMVLKYRHKRLADRFNQRLAEYNRNKDNGQ